MRVESGLEKKRIGSLWYSTLACASVMNKICNSIQLSGTRDFLLKTPLLPPFYHPRGFNDSIKTIGQQIHSLVL